MGVCVICGNETRLVIAENEVKFDKTEVATCNGYFYCPPHMLTEDAVIKWIFGFTLKERMTQFRDVFDVNLSV